MSAEALHNSEIQAGRAIGLEESTINNILEAQEPRIVELGMLKIETDAGSTREIWAARGISGPDKGLMDKGGSRITHINPRGDLKVLPQDMWAKLAQANVETPVIDEQRFVPSDFFAPDAKELEQPDKNEETEPVNGGKLVFDADPNSLSHTEKQRLFYAAADAMIKKGIAGYNKSVPAGDMGTNHPSYMDSFAGRVRESGDRFWKASITGKSVDKGGLEFRPHATGHNVYLGIDDARKKAGISNRPTRVTFSGAGNVSGYAGYYASQHIENGESTYSLRGYSDLGGTLYVVNADDKYGMHVDDELLQIIDNSDFKNDPRFIQFAGDKIAALVDVLTKKQPELQLAIHPDPNYIMQVPSDIFVPASVRDLINENNVLTLAADIIVEGGNDTITAKAYQIFMSRLNAIFTPGTNTNAEGVYVSMDERKYNIYEVLGKAGKLGFAASKQISTERAIERLNRMEKMATLLDTRDYQLASCALGMANMALQLGETVDTSIRETASSRSYSFAR